MPVVTVTKNQWNTIATTTTDTIFQNQSSNPMYLTIEDTTSLPTDEGVLLPPLEAIVIGTGNSVKVSTFNSDGKLMYMDLV